jgi:hypothetical protein
VTFPSEVDAPAPPIRPTTSTLTWADRRDHLLARWAVNRSGHWVAPGLYALGAPTPRAPVFVTANYTLSFDALRAALSGVDGYILVLDTQGINVWCAAGKGTFGTDELVHRIQATGLGAVVEHRRLIVPQLGAPGIAAHEVRKRSGFRVEYGPVRASDLPAYLRAGRRATPEMRRVSFDLGERLTLIPVELVHALLPLAVGAVVLFALGGWLAALGGAATILVGVVLFPLLLPWLPTRQFSTQGFVLGGLAALPFTVAAALGALGDAWWLRAGAAAAFLLGLPPVTAYLALNFTGSTPFTSRSGVRREIFAYVPVMAGLLGAGLLLALALRLAVLLGGTA